jgi:hypothetical protein
MKVTPKACETQATAMENDALDNDFIYNDEVPGNDVYEESNSDDKEVDNEYDLVSCFV